MICHHCHRETNLIEPIGRRDECPHCRFDAHVCKNCEFYDVKVYNECRETKAERVLEKEKANFCDEFKSHSRSDDGIVKAKNDIQLAANALFKK
jgi:hypothetical protein